MPVYANVSSIPEPYITGEGPESRSGFNEESAWWVYKMMQLSVDEDYSRRQPAARELWDEFYSEACSEVEEREDVLLGLYRDGERAEARRLMDVLTEESLTECYELGLEILDEFMGGQVPEEVETVDGEEDKTLVYLGVAVITLLIGGMLITYVIKSGMKF
jgi:dipeptidase